MGTKIRLAANLFVPISFLLIFCCLAHGATPVPVVVVQVRGEVVSIQVTEETSLRTVLDEACRVAQATCSGTELSTSIPAAPMSLNGTWTEIIDKLLEGSSLDYVALPASGTDRAQLIVTQPASGPEAAPNQIPRYAGGFESGAVIAPEPQTSDNEASTLPPQATPPVMAAQEGVDGGISGVEAGASIGPAQSMPPVPQDPATAEDFPTESSAPDSGGIIPHAVGGTPDSIPVFGGNGVEASPVTPKPADKYMPLPPFGAFDEGPLR